MENEKQYRKNRKIIAALSFAIVIAFFAVLTSVLWKPLTASFSNPEKFRSWVQENGVTGRLTFIGMMALQVIVALIPGEPMELGAGYAFGSVEGLVLCLIGAGLGTAIIYFFTKLLGVRMVESIIGREKLHSLKFMKKTKHLKLIVFVSFLIPGTPKDILTYFIGLTPMPLRDFLIITTVARIPSIVTSTITGNAVMGGKYRTAVLVYAVTAAVSLLGIFAYRLFIKHFRKEKEDSAQV